MSAVRWRPAGDNGRAFRNGTKDNHFKLESVFGSQITRDDIKSLRMIGFVTDDKFYSEVADIVEQVGEIEIWGTW